MSLQGFVLRLYNHQIPQKALGHISPVEALKDWQKQRPELFKKKVYNLTGLDNYGTVKPNREMDGANGGLNDIVREIGCHANA